MKKLLYILLLSTLTFGFAACGSDDDDNRPPMEFDDWNDDRSPNYKPEGYNPVLGEWIEDSKKENFKIIFTEGFWQKTEYKNNDGIWSHGDNLGAYKINDREIKRDGRNNGGDGKLIICQYIIKQEGDKEILTIILGNDIETITYYRYK